MTVAGGVPVLGRRALNRALLARFRPIRARTSWCPGTWKITRRRDAAPLAVDAFRPLSKRDTAALRREGGRLLEFAAGQAARHALRI